MNLARAIHFDESDMRVFASPARTGGRSGSLRHGSRLQRVRRLGPTPAGAVPKRADDTAKGAAAQTPPSVGLDELQRIDRSAVLAHLKVHVRTAGTT